MDLNGKAGKFKESEVTILMKLVSKYKDIVENKKTDAVVWKEKQAAWERITQELNALSGTMRTLKNVKGKYENLKKNTKKKFAEEKRNVYKTGGGVGAAVKFTPTDNAIKDIIGVSLEGLYNEFDSDATVVEFNENKENEPLRSPIQSLEEGVHILTNSPGITKKIETSISNDDFNNDSQTQSLTNVRPSNSSYNPCLYILRFAAKLQFGAKTQLVANTALRLVQRMKRDSLHTGRRPSGLCGAALLMAARLHEFSRSPGDIVKIVKVHESTLRKRLIEFGETPSSALTLDEFMTIDLEEEQDPPSFKAARKKDKERLQRLMEEEAENFTDLQKQIEIQLEKDGAKRRPPSRLGLKREFHEQQDADKFIEESTLGTLKNILEEEQVDDITEETPFTGLGPDIQSMGLANSIDDTSNALQTNPPLEMELTFDDLDEAELDTYIMTEEEFKCKKGLWYERNATYLEERKAKAEKAQKEREEGKPEKKRKRTSKKRNMGPATSAGEAIEKILIEKKISTKINYDVLKSLNSAPQNDVVTEDEEDDPSTSESVKQPRLSNSIEESQSKSSRRKTKQVPGGIGLPVNDVTETQEKRTDVEINENVDTDDTPKKVEASTMSEEEAEEDYYDEEPAPDESANEMGVLQMLRQHREDEDDNNPYDYEYDDY